MHFELDFQSGEPIYQQLIDQVKRSVSAGLLKPGEQLPTIREVAAELRINFNTVARAYRILHDEGVISTQQGRGTYVLGQPQSDFRASERRHILEQLVQGWLEEAKELGFRADEIERQWKETFSIWVSKAATKD